MSISHTLVRQYKDQSSNSIVNSNSTETVTGSMEKNIDKSVAVGTDTLYAYTLDRSILQSLCLYSDVALTIKTNSSGSPTDTIVLVAGEARMWSLAYGGLSLCPITANITALYITNASGGPAAFKLRALLT
jgi:hypothetical protein